MLAVLMTVFLGMIPIGVMAADTIKVGIVDSYVGPAAAFSKQALAAFEMAVADFNKKGGVLGKKIEVLTRDDKFKVDVALSMAKELFMREKVDIFVGGSNSSNMLAISDYLKKNKTPYFIWAGGSDKIAGEQGHRYVFHMSANTAMAGRAAALSFAKKPFKKYWIAGDDYSYGHDLADGCWDKLKKVKPEVELIGQSWWKVGESDFTPYITQIMGAKPDAIIAAVGVMSLSPFMKAAKTTGLGDKIPFWMNTLDYPTVKAIGLSGTEGIFGTVNYLIDYPDTPANKKFVADFHKATGEYPGWFAFNSYITAQAVVEGFKKAKTLNKEKLVDAMEGMTLETPTGPMKIRPYDHQLAQPIYWGVTKYVPGYDFLLVTKDVITVPAEETMTSVEEIKKAREAVQKK